MGWDELEGQYDPAGQVFGARPPTQYEPAGHTSQVVALEAPTASEYKPAEQGVGAVRPEASQYSNSGQTRQVEISLAPGVAL
jgi:hypothetical protein